jgi:hypothetical protein
MEVTAKQLLSLLVNNPDNVGPILSLAKQAGALSEVVSQPIPAPNETKPARKSEPSEGLQYLEIAVQEAFGVSESLLVRTRGKISREDPLFWPIRAFFAEAHTIASDKTLSRLSKWAEQTMCNFRLDHRNQLRSAPEYRKKVEAVRVALSAKRVTP